MSTTFVYSHPEEFSEDTAAATNSGLTPGYIGLTVTLVVFAVIVPLFLVGRWYMVRRRSRRIHAADWYSARHGSTFDFETGKSVPRKISTPQGVKTTGSAFTPDWRGLRESFISAEHGHSTAKIDNEIHASPSSAITAATFLPPVTFAAVPPPPSVYNNSDIHSLFSQSTHSHMFPTSRSINRSSKISHDSTATSAGLPYTLATIQRPFIQSLPDELSANVGQVVGVVQEFEDGWALCVALGENGVISAQGMVPSECLNKVPVDSGAYSRFK